ncbi:ring finger domain-containing protein [Sarocladium implicatum]|nr:ring finger domain-containing protein [Sarocladium implicatum]
MARLSAFYLLLACLLCAISSAAVDVNDITVQPLQDVPDWATDASLQLILNPSGDASPLQYAVIPLTPAVGLNESHTARGTFNIKGNIIAADSSNYEQINNTQDVAYLSCDDNGQTVSNQDILRKLMEVKPRPIKAILLYSTTANWCSIDHSNDLVYNTILTMADAAEAGKALSFLNDTDDGEVVKASIYGNVTDSSSSPPNSRNSVAMTVLYCVTGVITVLFATFIIVGAVRAHRHPERYGPRRGTGGRVRQSRARGIARAVLDTIPIVKYGSPSEPKPDPEVELDAATGDGRVRTPQRTASRNSITTGTDDSATTPELAVPGDGDKSTDSHTDSAQHQGCSICAEDFVNGEDVRVLPCNHQFHPGCVDPWLVNVAGTCPLCRYNLNPQAADNENAEVRESSAASRPNRTRRHTSSSRNAPLDEDEPPLPALGDDAEEAASSYRDRLPRRLSRQLRNAPVEERLAALRDLRVQQQQEVGRRGDGEDRHLRARLTERLKETFRIRTRAQSPQDRQP